METDWSYWVRSPQVREMLSRLRSVTSVDPFDAATSELSALALAVVGRLGADSPVSLLAASPLLFRWFAESFVLRHKLVEKISFATSVEEIVGALSEVCRRAEEFGDEKGTRHFARSGGVTALLGAMGRLTTVPDVQRLGIRALAAVSELRAKGIDFRVSERGGGADVIVGTMYHFRTLADVSLYGCMAIKNIATKGSNRQRLAERGSIEAVLVAMQSHKADPNVQKNGCGALANMSIGEGTEVRIADRGGIEVIIEAMCTHRANHGVQRNGCWALSNLAFSEKNLVRIVSRGGIEVIIAAMAMHKGNEAVAENGCWALANIAFDSDNEVRIAERGGIEAIVTSMQLHKAAAGLQRAGCRALSSILSTPAQHQRFMSQAILDAVGEAAQRFPDLREIRHSLDSIRRVEDPSVARAKREFLCTLVYAPNCAESCRARKGFYCERCYVPQRMFSCDTCETAYPWAGQVQFCEICFRRCHPGHAAVETFEPGRCSCANFECKTAAPVAPRTGATAPAVVQSPPQPQPPPSTPVEASAAALPPSLTQSPQAQSAFSRLEEKTWHLEPEEMVELKSMLGVAASLDISFATLAPDALQRAEKYVDACLCKESPPTKRSK